MAVLKECRAEDKNLLWGAALRSTFDHFYKSLIVLANPKTVVNDRYAKKEVKEQVLRADQLIKVIKQQVSESKELPSSKREMQKIAEILLGRNKENRKEYITKYEEMVQEMDSKKDSAKPVSTAIEENEKHAAQEEVLCPKCGSKLTLRTAKKGNNIGQQFYGCSNFPKCRYIKNIE